MSNTYSSPETTGSRITRPHSLTSQLQYSSPPPLQEANLKRNHPLNVSIFNSPLPTHNSSLSPLKDWPKDSFCNEFLSNKFPLHSSLCKDSDRVVCSGTPHDGKMGSCLIKRAAINVKEFFNVMYNKRDSIETSNSMWLIHDHDNNVNPCPSYEFKDVEKYMAGKDFVKRLAKASILSFPQGGCDQWVNGTTFMFISFDVHIYFKFISWYSLFNGIENYAMDTHQPPTLIIRLPQTKNTFLFPEFERELFSESTVVALQDLAPSNIGNLCFERVIITPWAFATNAFRCKMADAVARLRKKCYNCNSRGYPGSRYQMFRRKVLSACKLQDPALPHTDKVIRTIVIQLRKPYARFIGDQPSKISRLMDNPERFVNDIKAAFPQANVSTMVAEELKICDQISIVHKADVFIGVHGAGLVHLWWLQDHALMFELVPRSQISNPTFKMLSTLAGRRYYSYTRVKGGEKKVIVDSKDIIETIKKEY